MSKRRPKVAQPAEPPKTDGVPDGPIRAFWDYDGPLWTIDGPLPADAEWLHANLGLSPSLAAEIQGWTQQLEAWPVDQVFPASVRQQGDRIRRRLEDELAGRYELRWEF